MSEDEILALTSTSHFVNARGSVMTGGADSPGNSLTDFLHRFLIKGNKKWWKLGVIINVLYQEWVGEEENRCLGYGATCFLIP